MIEKLAKTQQPIAKVIAERWSGRAYDPTRPVSDTEVISLCEAARWAPSCYGDAPWRFIICNKFTDQDQWQKALACLSPGNRQWAGNAPLLILAMSANNFSHNGEVNRWAAYDTGAASLNLSLQATAMGFVSHQMGGFNSEKLIKSFELPSELSLWAIHAIGHPAAIETLDEQQRERELTPRKRRPLSEHFYSGSLNTPLSLGEKS